MRKNDKKKTKKKKTKESRKPKLNMVNMIVLGALILIFLGYICTQKLGFFRKEKPKEPSLLSSEMLPEDALFMEAFLKNVPIGARNRPNERLFPFNNNLFFKKTLAKDTKQQVQNQIAKCQDQKKIDWKKVTRELNQNLKDQVPDFKHIRVPKWEYELITTPSFSLYENGATIDLKVNKRTFMWMRQGDEWIEGSGEQEMDIRGYLDFRNGKIYTDTRPSAGKEICHDTFEELPKDLGVVMIENPRGSRESLFGKEKPIIISTPTQTPEPQYLVTPTPTATGAPIITPTPTPTPRIYPSPSPTQG